MTTPPQLRKSRTSRLRRALGGEQFRLYVLAIAIGVAVAYGTIGFRELIGLIQQFAYGSGEEAFFATLISITPWWQVLLAPTLGGLMVGLFVHFLMPGQRSHGVPDVMEACAFRGGRMDVKAGLGAAAAAAVSIGAGASVGREGPAVHIGASISAWVAERLQLSRSFSLTLLGCGVAAAVSASFNAPIAGVFFAIEVVIGNYALGVFTPIVISSVCAAMVIRSYFGDYPAFFVPDYFIDSLVEMPVFMVLGLVCAVVAAIFMSGIFFVQDAMARTPLPPWLRPAIGGLAVGAIALPFPEVLGVGYQATGLALHETLSLGPLAAIGVAKIVATMIALGCGFAGGVFSPSLVVGAMVGGTFGLVAAGIAPDLVSTQGAYAVVGMAGLASAVLGAPISTMLIVFELTSQSQLTIAVMVTCALSSLLVRQFVGYRSFFVWQLERRGVDLDEKQDQGLLLAATIGDTISDDYALVPKDMTVDEVRRILARDRPGAVFVYDDRKRLCGQFTSTGFVENTLGADEARTTAGDIARPCDNVVLAHASLDRALKMVGAQNDDYLPVVDDVRRRRVLGVVYHKDLVLAHNRALLDADDARHG